LVNSTKPGTSKKYLSMSELMIQMVQKPADINDTVVLSSSIYVDVFINSDVGSDSFVIMDPNESVLEGISVTPEEPDLEVIDSNVPDLEKSFDTLEEPDLEVIDSIVSDLEKSSDTLEEPDLEVIDSNVPFLEERYVRLEEPDPEVIDSNVHALEKKALLLLKNQTLQ
jgi:tetrahydromethanopterin S-methyltransferase subunit F